MIIPSRIKLGKFKPITIEYNNEECNEAQAYGLCYFDERIIYLARRINGKVVTKKEREISLIHEICHQLIDDMGYKELARDEEFIDELSINLRILFRKINIVE
jgi:hypothetical protein